MLSAISSCLCPHKSPHHSSERLEHVQPPTWDLALSQPCAPAAPHRVPPACWRPGLTRAGRTCPPTDGLPCSSCLYPEGCLQPSASFPSPSNLYCNQPESRALQPQASLALGSPSASTARTRDWTTRGPRSVSAFSPPNSATRESHCPSTRPIKSICP